MTQRQVDLQRLLELEQQRDFQQQSQEVKEIVVQQKQQNPLSKTMESLEKELNLDIFLSDKYIKKKKEKI